jgi:hypothetical protein
MIKRVLLCSICIGMIAGCASQKQVIPSDSVSQVQEPHIEGQKIHYKWTPTLLASEYTTDDMNTYSKITFGCAIVDSRETKSLLGHASKEKSSTGEVTNLVAGTSLENFCKTNIKKAFSFLMLQVTAKPMISLELEVSQFALIDSSEMSAEMTLAIMATNAEGITLWEGNIRGSNTLFTIPSGTNGYSECVSNCFISTISNLFLDTSFKDAVIKGVN